MTINEFIKDLSPELTMVDFWAPWCTACMSLMPTVDRVSEETGVSTVKVNVDESSDLAKSFGVRSIPCIIFFKNDEEVARFVGAKPYPEFLKVIEENK
jgi:thioredoxin 1